MPALCNLAIALFTDNEAPPPSDMDATDGPDALPITQFIPIKDEWNMNVINMNERLVIFGVDSVINWCKAYWVKQKEQISPYIVNKIFY